LKETKLLKTSEEDLKEAGEIIKKGGTVIFPTETVYGLGADAENDEAVKNIFVAKGRPSDNPLIVHVDEFDKIFRYVKEVTPNAKKLADKYWPGPMTLILEKKECISNLVSAGLNTVGIRIPESVEARQFLKYCDLPVAAPSANISGTPSPTTASHVTHDMMGRVDAIICGEPCKVGVESTVIDVTGDVPVILRPGGVTPEMVKEVCGDVIIDKNVNGTTTSEKPKSPGMKYKHYAPDADVILVEGIDAEDISKKILDIANNCDEKFIILCSEETKCKFESFNVMCLGSRNNPKTIARSLFDAFRKCDDLGYGVIILESIEDTGIGLAVMNRARRAAKK